MADVKISGLPAATTPLAGSEVLPIVQSSTTKKVSVDNLTAGKAVSALSMTATNLKTSPATANLDISGTTIAASGSDANVDVNINAKGSGVAYLNQRWGVNQSGTLVPAANNTYDIGNGANNPRDIELTRYLKVGATTSVGGATPSTSGAGITFPASQSASSDANTLDDYEEGTWTPTVAAFSGSLTSYTSSGTYTKIGRQVTLVCQFTITDNGTGSAAIQITAGVPFNAANFATLSFTGFNTDTNKVVGGYWNSATQWVLTDYNNGYPGGTNANVRIVCTYFV